jgi:hypothetical protein
MISTGFNSVSCSSTMESSTRAVAARAGGDHAVEAGILIGGHIAVGDAALATDIFRVRPSMNGSDRHHEPDAAGGRAPSFDPDLIWRKRSTALEIKLIL